MPVIPAGPEPVGRDDELAALRAAARALAGGQGGIGWLEGEPGIGKSTLLSAAMAEAVAAGCQTFRAVGDELGQRLPLRALIDALGTAGAADIVALLHRDPVTDAVDAPPAVAAAIERFLVTIDPPCASAPGLFLFDHLQWADAASLLAPRRVTVEDHVVERATGEDRGLPALHGAIRSRLDFLSPEAEPILRTAALLGPDFSVFDLSTVTGTRTSELLPALHEATAAGVLAESGDRLQFRHDLIREALYDATPASAP